MHQSHNKDKHMLERNSPVLDRNSPKPLYVQLEEILRLSIVSGEWEANQPILSENELSKVYGLSRMTVRSVITNLVNEGLLYRVQGKGTFVSAPKISTKSPAYQGVREQLEMQGYKIETVIIENLHIPPDNKVANILGIMRNEKIAFVKRVRFADGIPVSIHSSYMPVGLCPKIPTEELEKDQLCTILENRYGLRSASVSETLESVLASEEEAKLLMIEKGHPLLMLEDINRTQEGRVFEYTKIAYRGDKIKLIFDYSGMNVQK